MGVVNKVVVENRGLRLFMMPKLSVGKFGVRCMNPMESDVFWTKPVGRIPVGQANNAQSHAKKKSHRSPMDFIGIHRTPMGIGGGG
jgi:hypothetical protein